MAALLRSHLVRVFAQRARRLGIAVDDVLAKYQVSDLDDEVSIACDAFRELSGTLATRAADPRFGFRAALEMPRGEYGLIEYVVRNTPTLRALLEQLVRFSRLINAQLVASFDAATGRLEQRIEGEIECLGKQGNEFSLVHQTEIVRDVCGRRVTVDRVFFAHGAPAEPDLELAEYFGTTQILYACGFNGVILSKAALATPMVAADASLFRVLEARAAELAAKLGGHGDLAPVRLAIANELETGEPTARRIAKRLGASERTLHRRIAAQQTTFGTLVDQLRHQLAIAHLEDPKRTVTEVALLLGYSDGRAFARAFRRWTNMTPVEWRRSTLP